MDILIRNMEMPKERKMFMIEPDGSVWVQIKDTSYFCTGSKAVVLPEHGDLIDRDLWLATHWVSDVVIDAIKDAPVIVEATE